MILSKHSVLVSVLVLWEIYNLNADPGESTNFADKDSKRLESMKPELEEWLYSVVQSLNGKDYQ